MQYIEISGESGLALGIKKRRTEKRAGGYTLTIRNED
jgi:hypothetical protein